MMLVTTAMTVVTFSLFVFDSIASKHSTVNILIIYRSDTQMGRHEYFKRLP